MAQIRRREMIESPDLDMNELRAVTSCGCTPRVHSMCFGRVGTGRGDDDEFGKRKSGP